jgi:hypothetical protein
MNTRTFIITISWSLLALNQANLHAQSVYRTLTYTFQQGSTLTSVSIVELSSGPQGVIMAGERKRPFTVFKAEFEKIWSAFISSGAEKYTVDESSPRKFDSVNYYVFSATYMPDSRKRTHVVPKKKASVALISLAGQLRAYAK